MVVEVNGSRSDSTLRVLIASDIHLGHLENDPIRGEDSFIAFEEVLSHAVQYDVDFILLGGDLFDHAKPSPSCMYKCTQLIQKYCLGDKPVSVELLSDQIANFARCVNYEDPNLNVSYPILSIHGNHDDPVGQHSVSSLDILSISGLVNYFGKWSDYTHVRISPVLMQKGETKLALYGLSHLKDQRLARLFAEKKVEMDVLEDSNSWFNLFVLHQNRADRGPGNHIQEKVLPKFLDLVVWGHEHDSEVFPMKREKKDSENFFVLQPGSTVATSLAAGEALPKHCALLQIQKQDFTLTPLPLQTVRPFIFKTIVLSEENLGDTRINEHEKVQEFLKSKIIEAIEETKQKRSGHERQPELPLVRVNVFYERETQNFNKMRFGQNFAGLVANPNDILQMKKEKRSKERKEQVEVEEMDMGEIAVAAPDVESLIRSYYEALPSDKGLSVLSVRSMTDAVKDFTVKHDDEIFKKVFDAHRRHFVSTLMTSNPETEEQVCEQIKLCKQAIDAVDANELKKLIDLSVASKPATSSRKECVVLLSSDDETEAAAAAVMRGRGRGSRGGRGGRGRGRGKAQAVASPAPSPPVERRTPRRTAAQKTNSWLQNLSSERSTRSSRRSSDFDDSE